MGKIIVTGESRIEREPDTVEVFANLWKVCREYDEALLESQRAAELLRDILAKEGFLAGDLKTTGFSVNTEYESFEEQGVYRQRISGYRYNHSLKLSFDFDRERLGRILRALSESPDNPELSIGYTVKSGNAVRDRLIKDAVKDAKKKAAAMASAAGLKITGISEISCHDPRPVVNTGAVRCNMGGMGALLRGKSTAEDSTAAFAAGIVPENITAQDSVTVVFETE